MKLNMIALRLLLISSLFCIIGCVSTKLTMLSNVNYPPISPENVTIYLSEKEIPGPYEKVAIIHAEWDAGASTEQKMYEAVRKDAAKIGANGVFVLKTTPESEAEKVASIIIRSTGHVVKHNAEIVAVYVK